MGMFKKTTLTNTNRACHYWYESINWGHTDYTIIPEGLHYSVLYTIIYCGKHTERDPAT